MVHYYGENMEISLIATIAANGVISAESEQPWDYPAERHFFREKTSGSPIIMGHDAYENEARQIRPPLPSQRIVLLAEDHSKPCPPTTIVTTQIEEALKTAASLTRDAKQSGSEPTVYIAGGEAVYEKSIEYAHKLVLTELDNQYSGEVTFPDFDTDEWEESERRPDVNDSFSITHYERRQSPPLHAFPVTP